MEYLSMQSSFGLDGRTLFVTGAGGQLGAGFVTAALAAGARCVAADVTPEGLQRAAAENHWPSDRIALVGTCDIRSKEDIEAAFQVGVERFGSIDGLVNNAGVSVFEPFLERSEESIDWVMDVNLKGTIFCIQAFVHHRQVNGGGGSIVNVASHYGQVSPDPRIYTDSARRNSEIYGATKAGVIQMTRFFAVHLAEDSIRVNGIAPGGVRNPRDPQGADFQQNYGFRCPMGRMAETHEITGAMVFFMSPAASYINGQTLTIDGGTTAW